MDSVVWTNYAKFHHLVVTQKQKGNFLIYECDGPCGGYGNRIQGITIALMLSILSNRTFLIQMSHPLDINRLLHPNAIKWNYTGYTHDRNKAKIFDLVDKGNMDKNWPLFSKKLLNSSISIITIRTNLGLSWYFDVFDDKWSKMFHDWFNVTKDSILIYGCVTRYLFTYDKIVIDAINKEMQEHSLIPGLYVSVHFRSYLEIDQHYTPYPYFNCAVLLAKKLNNNSTAVTSKVYWISDSEKADELANTTEYSGKITVSRIKKVHVDKVGGLLPDVIFAGFVGLIVNIEVAAKGAIFMKSGSTVSDLIESIGRFTKGSVIMP